MRLQSSWNFTCEAESGVRPQFFSFYRGLTLLLFALGGMGGGDVKLGAAVFAWAGTQSLWPALFVVGVTGLLLAVLGLLADALSKHYPPPLKSRRRKLARALSAKRGVPYGVALAAGGLAALPAYW